MSDPVGHAESVRIDKCSSIPLILSILTKMAVKIYRKGFLGTEAEREQAEELLREIQTQFEKLKVDLRILVEPTIPAITANGPELLGNKPDLVILKDGFLVIVELKNWKGEVFANLAPGKVWEVDSGSGRSIPYGDYQLPPHQQALNYNDQLSHYMYNKFKTPNSGPISKADLGVTLYTWVITARDSAITDETEKDADVNGFFKSKRFKMFPINELPSALRRLVGDNSKGAEVFDDIVNLNSAKPINDLMYLFADREEYEREVQYEIPGIVKLFKGNEEEMARSLQLTREFNMRNYSKEVLQVWKRSTNAQTRRTSMVTLINWGLDQNTIDSMLEEALSSTIEPLVDLSLEYFIVRSGGPKFLDSLTNLLDNDKIKNKEKVLEALARINSPKLPTVLISIYRSLNSPPLLDLAKAIERDHRDSDQSVRLERVESKTKRRHYIHRDFLHTRLKKCSECQRECRSEIYQNRAQLALSIVNALGKIRSWESSDFLRSLLKELTSSVKDMKKTEEYGNCLSTPMLICTKLAEATAISLLELQDRGAAPLVMDLIGAVDEDERGRYVNIYCGLAGPESLDVLIDYAKSSDEWTAAKAIKAIGDLRAEEAFDDLFGILSKSGSSNKKGAVNRALCDVLSELNPTRYETLCLGRLMDDKVPLAWKEMVLKHGFVTAASRHSIEPLFKLMDGGLRTDCVNALSYLYKSYPKEVKNGVEKYLGTTSEEDRADAFRILYEYYASELEQLFDHESEFPEDVLWSIFYIYQKSNRTNRVRKFLWSENKKAREDAWDILSSEYKWLGEWGIFSVDRGTEQSELVIDGSNLLFKYGSKIEEITPDSVTRCRKVTLDGLNNAVELNYCRNEHNRRILICHGDRGRDLYAEIMDAIGSKPIEDSDDAYLLDWYIWDTKIFPVKKEQISRQLSRPSMEFYHEFASCKIRTIECTMDSFNEVSEQEYSKM